MAFTFHANTLAFGGQLDQSGARKYLPSQASVTLPPDGGVGEATISNYHEDGVSFYRAESRVLGNSFEDTIFRTFANVLVTGLDIERRIQVDVLNSSVTSINRRENDCTSESRISFDANIVGLVIDGHPIDVEFDTVPFRRNGTYGEFIEWFRGLSAEDATHYINAFNWPPDECQTMTEQAMTFHVPRRCTTGIRASLLRATYPALTPGEIPGITRKGYTIEVAGFGLIHLGEVLLKAGRRRLNLMRIELGKTLDNASRPRVSMQSAGAEPRLRAIALDDLVPEPNSASAPSGGYTFCSGEGNGTDFLP